MNIIAKSLSSVASTFLGNSLRGNLPNVIKPAECGVLNSLMKQCLSSPFQGFEQVRTMAMSLWQMHKRGPHIKKRPSKNPFGNKPFAKGVVLKTLIKKPKKPNSANRKCVLVKLSTGKEMVAYVPGIGHNLQEHNIVLCRVGRVRDTPGVKIKCVRGAYDLPHVAKQTPK